MTDNVPPSVTLVSPSPNGSVIVNTSYFYVNVTFNEAVTSCILNVNSVNYGMTVSENTCYRNHSQNVNDASNQTYYVSAQDLSFNQNQSQTVTFHIDWNNPPNVPIWNYAVEFNLISVADPRGQHRHTDHSRDAHFAGDDGRMR